MLNTDSKDRLPEKCSRRKSECDSCWEHSTILEEMMKMILLGLVLWAGVTFGTHFAPYPLNLIVSTDISHPPPMYDFPFPSPKILKRLRPITADDINRAISLSKFSVSSLARLEENLSEPDSGSAAQGLSICGLPSQEAMNYYKSSLTITKASQNLIYSNCTWYGVEKDECSGYISTISLRESEYGPECAQLERFTCPKNKMSSKYRMFDGSCNNPVRSSWGQALTGYKRLLHPRYADGIEQPHRAASRNDLPSPRLVSVVLCDNMDVPEEKKTIVLPLWSQFIFHDLVHTPISRTIHSKEAISCCDSSGRHLKPRYIYPSCMAISVPYDDPVYGPKSVDCMDYVRSVTTFRGDCTFGPAEQMNQATHFLDGSHIYGTNSQDAAALREKTGGLLKTTTIDNEELLPLVAEPDKKCLIQQMSDACFATGDVRANLHPGLTSLHTLMVREHNRIAKALANLNPSWNSDKLYHEARRIVVAELQHITYNHWLPALTGKTYDELYDGYDTSYNQDVDPTITNSFATAGFQFVNSQLDQDIEMLDENNNLTSHRLQHNYLNPQLLVGKKGLENLLRGMINQKSQRLDLNYDDDLRHFWLGGLDVLAVDMQRGRDHGLAAYMHYRELCGLPPTTSFEDLSDVMTDTTIKSLQRVYEDPIDIELVVGIMSEIPLEGSLLGPTATCLIREQLQRTRVADRYFYTHAHEAGAFSKRQLAELRRASLAALLCSNTRLAALQRDVFRPPSGENPIVSCDAIKRVNLEAWQDPSEQPDILTRTNKWIKNKVGSNSTR